MFSPYPNPSSPLASPNPTSNNPEDLLHSPSPHTCIRHKLGILLAKTPQSVLRSAQLLKKERNQHKKKVTFGYREVIYSFEIDAQPLEQDESERCLDRQQEFVSHQWGDPLAEESDAGEQKSEVEMALANENVILEHSRVQDRSSRKQEEGRGLSEMATGLSIDQQPNQGLSTPSGESPSSKPTDQNLSALIPQPLICSQQTPKSQPTMDQISQQLDPQVLDPQVQNSKSFKPHIPQPHLAIIPFRDRRKHCDTNFNSISLPDQPVRRYSLRLVSNKFSNAKISPHLDPRNPNKCKEGVCLLCRSEDAQHGNGKLMARMHTKEVCRECQREERINSNTKRRRSVR